MNEKPSLEQILKDRFNIDSQRWQDCLSQHRKTSVSLVHILVSKGLISEDDLLETLSRQFDIPYQRINPADIDNELARKVPAKLVTHYNFMPLKLDQGAVRIAVNDPLEVLTLDEISLFLNREVKPVLARLKDIQDAIKNFYGVGAQTMEAMSAGASLGLELLGPEHDKDIKDAAIDPSVIKFLNEVLSDSIKQRATDVHFEPFENDLRVRYRIDGILYEVPCPAAIKHFQASIATRIKVMANLDIAEKRRPQDGRINIKMGNELYDLRVSIMPTPFGESIGIRILSRSAAAIGGMEDGLGLGPHELKVLDRMIKRPHGIILVTGPTGSGKTTTLYACLNKLNSAQRKILTIEDPIEYQLKGIIQMQIEPKIGFTFANALRSMLRHDPNVMMLGEIRDAETAELAVRISLTGHLVFSTLHTNDAPGAITRLLDMGVDSFLVSSSVILIIAQRLVRIICPHCKERYNPDTVLLAQFTPDNLAREPFFRGRGCEACRFSGYKGRTGIFEFLEVSDPTREMILKKLPAHQIKEKEVSLGMKVLKEAGWAKVMEGLTTVEEVLRVTQEGQLVTAAG